MDVFVARQPIFDQKLNVFGYELLYRFLKNNVYESTNDDSATSAVIANSFLLIGIDKLTRGRRAFINFTFNLLKNEMVTILPKEIVAVEILENIEIDAEIVAKCQILKQLGYLLVLDDFIFDSQYEPLINLADIIKIDFLNTPVQERRELIQRIRSPKIKFLAEKVETREDFEQALELGYSYFQGYFFSKPVILSTQDIPAYKLNYLQLLQEVNRPEPNFDHIENIIKRDVSISYKLLKVVNSASFGFRTRINSIKHALVILGLRETKKWLSLILLRDLAKDNPDEQVTSSILRARFGELLAPKIGLREYSSDLFLMGMFSMIDAFLNRPMPEILDELPISEDIKKALLGTGGRFQDVYQFILSYEKGEWDKVHHFARTLQADETEVAQVYIQSLEWANQFFDLAV